MFVIKSALKKTFTAVAVVAMLSSSYTSVFASSAESSSQQVLAKKAIASAKIMDNYIHLSSDNRLYIDPEAKTKVTADVYVIFERGVNTINQGISSGAIQIQNGEVVTKHSDSSIQSEGSTYILSHDDAAYFADSCTAYGNRWALAAAITGIFGLEAVSVASAIMSFGNYEAARLISKYNGPSGIKFTWYSSWPFISVEAY